MFEKIYGLLLRLYPARFRERYQAEALQLVRDRLHGERDLLCRLRIWSHLLADLAGGLPQAHRNRYAAARAQVAPQLAGVPSFRSLDEVPLKPQSVLFGSLLAAAGLIAFAFLMTIATPFPGSSRATPRLSAAQAGAVHNPDVQTAAQKFDAKLQVAAQMQGCGFERAGLLPGNLAYVQIGWFADTATCAGVARDIFAGFTQVRAIIIDLRTCKAGNPNLARQMAQALSGKSVFVLTSARTFPGAARFTAELKRFAKTTVVGEPTIQAAALHTRTASAPASGITPDVQVTAAEALATAERLALNQTR